MKKQEKRKDRLEKMFIAAVLASSVTLHAQTFQAEDFTAAFDTTVGNLGGAYRLSDVDIEITQDEGGGYNVGWMLTVVVVR